MRGQIVVRDHLVNQCFALGRVPKLGSRIRFLRGFHRVRLPGLCLRNVLRNAKLAVHKTVQRDDDNVQSQENRRRTMV